MLELYRRGVRCWLPHEQLGWIGAEITKRTDADDKCTLEVTSEDGTSVSFTFKIADIEAGKADLPLLRNPPSLETTEDLTTLSYLNEPAVLHAIRARYEQLEIYTFSGIVLIAVNPFDRIDNLYTPEVVQTYSGRQRGERDPHLFSIAENAYRCMIQDGQNQTIIVSGESGAGKTVSAKYIMRYFATVDDPDHPRKTTRHGSDLSEIEREILATNPIMEAFGNAKTTRNDNSSRFGKYLEIRFNSDMEIVGARTRTYLLERSRIVFHPATERNYHIFYQLVRGASSQQRAEFMLTGVEDYHYLNQGDPDIVGINDAQEFKETCKALSVVGISEETQHNIFQLLAALLHLGNIQVKATRSSVVVSSEDPALVETCRLLGISAQELAKWLMKKQVQMRDESIISDLDADAALVVRDSVAKYIYSLLFDWLVNAVNRKLLPANARENCSFIGVLDIYGFEHFQKNSFEQFCINYANEKLQQEFNQHVFKLEQEEYEREEIDWTYIDFVDNQPCIELIEGKLGILGLLDEESRLPSGSDEGFAHKLYTRLDTPGCQDYFTKSRFGQTAFVVKHYAMEVCYETGGFVEKNRDTVTDKIVEVLNHTTNPFLKSVLDLATENASKVEQANKADQGNAAAPPKRRGPTAKPKKPTLGNIFKTSLIELMNIINSTNAHYIRCIKPNETKEAWKFDGPLVLSQLRACGVLETIRISSAGFSTRFIYEDFAQRYDILLHSSRRNNPSAKSLCEEILKESIQDQDKYQLGKTKVFLCAGQLAYLEGLRSQCQAAAATTIQRMLRMYYWTRKYASIRLSVVELQTVSRGYMARLRYKRDREYNAAVRLQAQYRGNRVVSEFKRIKESLVKIQSALRGMYARRIALFNRKTEVAIMLQQAIRRHLVRSTFVRQIKVLETVQSMVRRRFAQRELLRLRKERNSVKNYQETTYRLENKVVSLQNLASQRQEEIRVLNEDLKRLEATLETTRAQHEEICQEQQVNIRRLEGERDDLLTKLKTSDNKVVELDQDRAKLTKDTADLQNIVEAKDKEILELNGKILELEKALEDAKDAALSTSKLGAASVAAGYAHVRMQEAAQYGYGTLARAADGSTTLVSQDRYYAEDLYGYDNDLNRRIEQILVEPNGASDELLSKLIRQLNVPMPKSNDVFRPRDVLYPSNMINLLLSEMWRLGYVNESEKFMGLVLKTIQETVQKQNSSRMIPYGPFWMTNIHEVYSFLCLAEVNILQSTKLRQEMTDVELAQYERLMALAKQDTEVVMFNTYHLWMKEIKKQLDKMIVPAVVEEQSIPGFQTEESTRFFSKVFSSGTTATMNDLLLLLTRVYTSMSAFHLEPGYIKQPILELLTMIGSKAFNDIIMRKGFLTWKRAVHINYNVTRIEEWCKGHDMPEGILPLDRLMQSVKLLQLKKNFEADVEILFDICWALTPSQIQRLVLNYHAADYEQPIPPKVLELFARRVKEDRTGSTQLMVDVRPISDSGPFEMCPPRTLRKIEPYIPGQLEVPKLRLLTELTTQASRLHTEMSADMHTENSEVNEPGDFEAMDADNGLVEAHVNSAEAVSES